jgi:integrase
MRNLLRRGRIWYFKKMVDGKTRPVSLETEDLELAKAKRNDLENKARAKQWEKIVGPRTKAGTLKDVFDEYEKFGGLVHTTMRANKSMLMRVCQVGLKNDALTPADVRLTELTEKLARDYQDELRRRYEAAEKDEKAKRMARDLADRTSKSTLRQAKSIFCKRRQLIERYREAGITVPDCVLRFRSAGTVGKTTTKVYFPPSDAILKETFKRVGELEKSGFETYEQAYVLFWAALATGCRRNEIADMKVSDLVELDGRLWVGAGLGKDGKPIQIPLIGWPVDPLGTGPTPESIVRQVIEKRKKEEEGESDPTLLKGHATFRYDTMPDELNAWMTKLGWRDEKKLHALRAYIGSKIYSRNPRLAQLYLRHKSIATTEQFYSHFVTLSGVFDMGPAAAPVPAAPPMAVLPKAVGV